MDGTTNGRTDKRTLGRRPFDKVIRWLPVVQAEFVTEPLDVRVARSVFATFGLREFFCRVTEATVVAYGSQWVFKQ